MTVACVFLLSTRNKCHTADSSIYYSTVLIKQNQVPGSSVEIHTYKSKVVKSCCVVSRSVSRELQ